MTAPVIHICGWPGSGKATIGRILAHQLGGRLIENHLMIDPASAVFDRGDPRHAALRREVRTAIFRATCALPADIPLILTDALASTDHDLFTPTQKLAQARKAPMICVTLNIQPDENIRRLQSDDRKSRAKLTDPSVLETLRARHDLLSPNDALQVDVTALSAQAAATEIQIGLQQRTEAAQ